MWQLWAAIGAAASDHLGTTMSARNQKAARYAGDVNISDVQYRNLEANRINSPYFETATRNINYANQQQRLDNLEKSMPGYKSWASELSAQAQRGSQGYIEKDIANSIARRAAERAYSTGVAGAAQGAAMVRDYGLEQLDTINRSKEIIQMLANLGKVDLTSVGNMYGSLTDAVSAEMRNKEAKQADLDAKQAAETLRKNAKWMLLSQTGRSYAEWKGKKSGYAAQAQYESVY